MKKNSSLQLTLAGTTDPDEASVIRKALDAVRSGATQMQTCIASMLDILEEPLKTKFIEVKTQINQMLASLPASDMVPAANASNGILQQLLGVMANAQMMMTSLTEIATNARKEAQTALASLTGEVEKAVQAKISSGELLPKEKLDEKITDATSSAIAQAKKEFAETQKLVGERRQQLTVAKLCLPDDEVLAKKDDEFTPLKTRAEKRAKEIEGFGLPADRIMTLCWNADDAAYADALALMQTVTKKGPRTGANGFVARTTTTNSVEKDPKKLGFF